MGSVEDMGEVQSELGRWVECGECGGHGGGAE